MAAIDDNEGAIWESDEPTHYILHVALDLAISDHLQPEQGQECQDPGIEIGNKGIARESLAVTDYSSSCGMHLDLRLRGTERGQQHTKYRFVMLRLHDFFQV